MRRWLLSGAVGVVLISGPLEGQVFTPVYLSPRMTNDLGVAVSDGPGNFLIEAMWRGGPYGLRVGYADAEGGLLSLGGELRLPIQIPDAPLGLVFAAGAQGLVGDDNGYGVQGGLSGGYSFDAGDVVITPHLHPRVALIREVGEGTSVAFEAMADLGFDIEVQGLVIGRVAVTLRGAGATFGAGIALRQ